MTKLQKLYSTIQNLKELGLELGEDLLKQTAELEQNIIKKEILPVISENIEPVISQIQRFIFFPLQKLFCEGSSIPVRIWASVDKQNVHSLFLLILSAKHFYPFHRLVP